MSNRRAMMNGLTIALAVSLAVSAISFGAASAAAKGKPSFGCSPGFEFHLTTTQTAELPKSQKAIDDGLATKEELIAIYQARIDHNGNDKICVQEPPGWANKSRNPLVEYLYNAVDDASSSPNWP